MDTFSKAKEGLANMIHEGADAIGIDIFDELPHVQKLASLQTLAIKVETMEEVTNATSAYIMSNELDFAPIKFKVRREGGDKALLLVAELRPETGFTVFDPADETAVIMNVNLPFEDDESMGKIKHPSGATLYNVNDAKSKGGKIKYVVQKSGTEREYLFLRKERPLSSRFAKMAAMTFDDNVYRLTEGRKTVARIVPKNTIAGTNAYMLSFPSGTSKDVQARAVALGVALLLTLNVAYHELRNLLKESVKADD